MTNDYVIYFIIVFVDCGHTCHNPSLQSLCKLVGNVILSPRSTNEMFF